MHIHSIADRGLGNISYLIDLGDGSALVIDPERDPAPYLAAAKTNGLVIRHVAETHLHADFVSGSRELVAKGAGLIAPRESWLAHPHRPVDDGEEVEVGDLTLRVMATPGHTPEHVAYVLCDGTTPRVAFTGGTLMTGGVARPDLVSEDLTIPLAHDAYRSVRRLLEVLPGDVEVRPTHGSGSFCASGPVSHDSVSTVASERRHHPASIAANTEMFVDTLLAGLGSFPDYFLRLRRVNREGPDVFGVELPRLDLVDVEGRIVVDVRPIDRFAAGHIPGSVSIELRDQFGTWLGWLFEPDVPVVFVIDSDQDERELVRQAFNVGHEAIVGKVGIDDWTATGGALAGIDLVAGGDIARGTTVVDVRQQEEWGRGHVDNAIHIELGAISSHTPGLDGAVLHCGHGQRAMTAASLLRRRGDESTSVTLAGHEAITAGRS